jgi:hypothetical protein
MKKSKNFITTDNEDYVDEVIETLTEDVEEVMDKESLGCKTCSPRPKKKTNSITCVECGNDQFYTKYKDNKPLHLECSRCKHILERY